MEEIKLTIPKKALTLFIERGIESVTMQNVADACHIGVATLYRYYGTKSSLVAEVYIQNWNAISQDLTKQYRKLNGHNFTAREDFDFCLECIIYLYQHYTEFLRFSHNFDVYVHIESLDETDRIQLQGIRSKAMENFIQYCYKKAYKDHTIRVDLGMEEIYTSTLVAMFCIASHYAEGTVNPKIDSSDRSELLKIQKEAYMNYLIDDSPCKRQA